MMSIFCEKRDGLPTTGPILPGMRGRMGDVRHVKVGPKYVLKTWVKVLLWSVVAAAVVFLYQWGFQGTAVNTNKAINNMGPQQCTGEAFVQAAKLDPQDPTAFKTDDGSLIFPRADRKLNAMGAEVPNPLVPGDKVLFVGGTLGDENLETAFEGVVLEQPDASRVQEAFKDMIQVGYCGEPPVVKGWWNREDLHKVY